MLDEPVSLDEQAERARIESEVREDIVQRQALEAEAGSARDRAFLALVIGVTLYAAVVLPTWALILGAAFRMFRWASGW